MYRQYALRMTVGSATAQAVFSWILLDQCTVKHWGEVVMQMIMFICFDYSCQHWHFSPVSAAGAVALNVRAIRMISEWLSRSNGREKGNNQSRTEPGLWRRSWTARSTHTIRLFTDLEKSLGQLRGNGTKCLKNLWLNHGVKQFFTLNRRCCSLLWHKYVVWKCWICR